MKKIMVVISLVVAAVAIGTYLSKDIIIDALDLKQAYGVIVYGDDIQTRNNIQIGIEKKARIEALEVKKKDELMILKVSDVKTLMKLGLINRIKQEAIVKEESLEFKDNTSYLWSQNKEESSVEYDYYQGNVVIGDGRYFADKYLIVPDMMYESMHAKTYRMLVLNCKDNPKTYLSNFMGHIQLTTINKAD